MDCRLVDEPCSPCSSPANSGWVGGMSGYVYLHHCSEIGQWTSAWVWFIKWSSNVTSRALHSLTQHLVSHLCASALPLYPSKLKDQGNSHVQCFICIARIRKIKGGLPFSLTSSASLWLVKIFKMDDSIVQTLLVIFWAHFAWTVADRNQIYMCLSFSFLKENPVPREQGSNTPQFDNSFLFSVAISWVSFGLAFICYRMSTTFSRKFLWFIVHYRF